MGYSIYWHRRPQTIVNHSQYESPYDEKWRKNSIFL